MPSLLDLPAPLRPLDLHSDVIHGHKRRIASTPAISTAHGQHRLSARKLVDPILRAKSAGALDLQPEFLKPGDHHWTEDTSYQDQARELALDWLPELVAFLFEEIPGASAQELKVGRQDWAQHTIDASRSAFYTRQHHRIFGTPQEGDLVLSNSALMLDGEGPFWAWTVASGTEGDPRVCHCQTHAVYGAQRHSRWFSDNPHSSIYIVKLGPKSLARLPRSALAAHQKLSLLAEQTQIEADRAANPITDRPL